MNSESLLNDYVIWQCKYTIIWWLH